MIVLCFSALILCTGSFFSPGAINLSEADNESLTRLEGAAGSRFRVIPGLFLYPAMIKRLDGPNRVSAQPKWDTLVIEFVKDKVTSRGVKPFSISVTIVTNLEKGVVSPKRVIPSSNGIPQKSNLRRIPGSSMILLNTSNRCR